jgi:hypothetical protein
MIEETKAKPWEQRGWLVSYLAEGDRIFGAGRIAYWFKAAALGKLPDGPIPRINFVDASNEEVDEQLPFITNGPPLSARGARTHIEKLLTHCHGGWEGLRFIIEWIAFGLAVIPSTEDCPVEPMEGWSEYLYKNFELGRLQAANADVFGSIISEYKGKGRWNQSAFYPTPQPVCNLMTEMTIADTVCDGGDVRLMTVNDPCVGTGRMLMSASNYSLCLSAQDIDPLVVNACSINMALYAPWVVYSTPELKGAMELDIEYNQATGDRIDALRRSQGHPTARGQLRDPEYTFDNHGQGTLSTMRAK